MSGRGLPLSHEASCGGWDNEPPSLSSGAAWSLFSAAGAGIGPAGDTVIRVNCCGGDVVDWLWPHTRPFRKKATVWSAWIARLMDEKQVMDLHVFGDWRPLHRKAVLLSRVRGIRI